MWIILFFACVSVILPNNAQELTSYSDQTVTETPYANSAAQWDSTRLPVTLTIRNGRPETPDISVKENSDNPVYYSNQWQPILLPIRFSGNGDDKNHLSESSYITDHQFVPTYLRRTDIETNNTVPYNRSPEQGERNEFSAVPIPFPQIFFYPAYSNETSESIISGAEQVGSDTLPEENISVIPQHFQTLDFNRNNQGFVPLPSSGYYPIQSNVFLNNDNLRNNTEIKEISSTSTPKATVADSRSSTTTDKVSETVSVESISPLPARIPPVPLERNIHGFIPPMLPAFYPPSYPFFPFSSDGGFHPTIPFLPNDPNFDRETGSEVKGPSQNVPESKIAQEDVAETVPRETSTNTVPLQALPLPVGGFPYGLLPPPFLPPLFPNVPVPRGLPLNPLPLPQPINLPRENIVVGVAPQLPTIPAKPPIELAPEVVSQTDLLKPEPSLISVPPVNPVEIVPSETPNADKIPYEFGFDMNDGKGNDQHRKEVSDASGVVTGSYGFRDAFGMYRMVSYIADKEGFRAFIKSNEPGVASSGSADVVVMAEQPPPRAITEGIKAAESEVVIIPDEASDLLSAASSVLSK